MIDDLDQLEEAFGTTLRLALRRAADGADAEGARVPDHSFVPVLVEAARRPPHRRLAIASIAACLLAAIAVSIIVVTVRRSTPSTHAAVEIAPGWTLGSAGPLGVRTGGAFVWDGSGAVVWGGAAYDQAGRLQPAVNDGAVYDSTTDRWSVIDDAPITGRRLADAAWTGSRVVIWGGVDDDGHGLRDGALLDPESGKWTPMAPAPAQVSGDGSAAVWSGSELLVWGGPPGSKGAAYDPTSNSWRVLPDAPIAVRPIDSATWAGTEMVVWSDGDGATYNPVIDKWQAMSPSPLQPARVRGVWTGSDVVFLGGASTGALTESAAYHPATDTWQPLAPGPTHPGLGFAWTGSTVLGVVKGVVLAYDPVSDSWTQTDAKIDALPFGTWGDDRYVFMTADGAGKVRIGFYQPPESSPKEPMPTYDLTLPGARMTDDEMGTAGTTDSALWKHEDDSYLSLTVIPREPGGPKGLPAPMTPVSSFPSARGTAWYGELAHEAAVSSTLWWEQPDQSVWLMDAHWYGDTPPGSAEARRNRIVGWALDITTPAESTYELRDPGISLIGFGHSGERRTRVRTWAYGGQQIVLLVIENSGGVELANLFARGVPQPITIESRVGAVVTESGGDTSVGWMVDDLTSSWATLTIPAALAGQIDDIVHSLRLAT